MSGRQLGIQRFENPWGMTDKPEVRVEKLAAKLDTAAKDTLVPRPLQNHSIGLISPLTVASG